MTEIIGVRLKKSCKIYYFSPAGQPLKKGDNVIVETTQGVEFGEVAFGNTFVSDEKIVAPLKPIVRVATEDDKNKLRQRNKKQKEAFAICAKKIKQHKLNMHLISAEYTFDQSKLVFSFTSEGRVDFRALVKDLASVFHIRIELRQVGVRDEARMSGGLGICGRGLCCASFLNDFEPVSINMAKEQNLSLNPTKISGACGRLMCCLKYEQPVYEELSRTAPAVNSTVTTPCGKGVVVSVDLFKQMCDVKDLDESGIIREFPCSQCCQHSKNSAKQKNSSNNSDDESKK